MTFRKLSAIAFTLLLFTGLSGCSPEVGSEAWCEQMKEKPKGDWSSNDAADFAQHCLLK